MAIVAFLGAGLIGSGMAEASLKRGEKVRVWNRSRAKAEPLGALGATVCDDPTSAVQGAARVHIALTADDAVDAVMDQLWGALDSQAVVIDHSTTAPDRTKARAERSREKNVAYLHAPVFMSPDACRNQKGMMVVCGPGGPYERVREALDRMSGQVWYVGERGDLAAAYKLFGNAMLLSIAGTLADIYTLGDSLGIDAESCRALFDRFDVGASIGVRGKRMAAADFEPAFALSMARKDLGLMLDLAGDAPLAIISGLAGRMDQLVEDGHADADFGVLAKHAVEESK